VIPATSTANGQWYKDEEKQSFVLFDNRVYNPANPVYSNFEKWL